MPDKFPKPDLNAPRFRKKKTSLLSGDFFDWFHYEHPETEIKDRDIKKIVRAFNELQYKTVINERDGIELMSGLGYVFIGSCPRIKGNNIDVIRSREFGYKVQHQNFDTNQWVCKIYYTNFGMSKPFKNSDMWYMSRELFCRELRRGASEAYRKDYKKYHIVDCQKHIFAMLGKANRELLAKQKAEADELITD